MAAKIKKKQYRSTAFDRGTWDPKVKTMYTDTFREFPLEFYEGHEAKSKKPQDSAVGNGEWGLGNEGASLYARTFIQPKQGSYEVSRAAGKALVTTLSLVPEGASGMVQKDQTTYAQGVGLLKKMSAAERAHSMKPRPQMSSSKELGMGKSMKSMYKETYLRPDTGSMAIRARKADVEGQAENVAVPYGDLAQSVHQRDYARPAEKLYREVHERGKAGPAGPRPSSSRGEQGYGLGACQSMYAETFREFPAKMYMPQDNEGSSALKDQIDIGDKGSFGKPKSMYTDTFREFPSEFYEGHEAKSKKPQDSAVGNGEWGLGNEGASLYARTFIQPNKGAYEVSRAAGKALVTTLSLVPEGASGMVQKDQTTYAQGVGLLKKMSAAERAHSMKPRPQMSKSKHLGMGSATKSMYKETFLRPDTGSMAIRARKADVEGQAENVAVPYGDLAQSVHQRDFSRPPEKLYREVHERGKAGPAGPKPVPLNKQQQQAGSRPGSNMSNLSRNSRASRRSNGSLGLGMTGRTTYQDTFVEHEAKNYLPEDDDDDSDF